MNDTNILLARQNNCDLVLITEEGGQYPQGANVFKGGNTPVDITNMTSGIATFMDRNLSVDWEADFPKLANGTNMFRGTGLTSFSGNLPELTNANSMFFSCANLTSFSSNLPELTDGGSMFSRCIKLISFSSGLPKLSIGNGMFMMCTGLTSFSSDLPNLSTADNMFFYCKLDETSVLRVLNTIPTYTSGAHNLHLGKSTNYINSTAIATLLNTTTPIAASTSYSYKGWTITITD